jgi:hypothetical protein
VALVGVGRGTGATESACGRRLGGASWRRSVAQHLPAGRRLKTHTPLNPPDRSVPRPPLAQILSA